jgi:Arc/MetJ-type ribon-helix-helix transcriptional regulator
MGMGQDTVVVNLGPFREAVEKRVKAGAYASTDEVIQAGLSALDREEADNCGWDDAELIRMAEEALADPEPSIPATQVFRELRAKYGRPESEPSS